MRTGDMTEHPVLKYLHLVHRLLARLEMSDYDNLASGAGQARILRFVHANPDIAQPAVAEHLEIHRTTANQAIRRLVECQYLRRKRDPRDRRGFILRATPMATALNPAFDHALQDRNDALLMGLSSIDLRTLSSLLISLAANIASELQDRGMRRQ